MLSKMYVASFFFTLAFISAVEAVSRIKTGTRSVRLWENAFCPTELCGAANGNQCYFGYCSDVCQDTNCACMDGFSGNDCSSLQGAGELTAEESFSCDAAQPINFVPELDCPVLLGNSTVGFTSLYKKYLCVFDDQDTDSISEKRGEFFAGMVTCLNDAVDLPADPQNRALLGDNSVASALMALVENERYKVSPLLASEYGYLVQLNAWGALNDLTVPKPRRRSPEYIQSPENYVTMHDVLGRSCLGVCPCGEQLQASTNDDQTPNFKCAPNADAENLVDFEKLDVYTEVYMNYARCAMLPPVLFNTVSLVPADVFFSRASRCMHHQLDLINDFQKHDLDDNAILAARKEQSRAKVNNAFEFLLNELNEFSKGSINPDVPESRALSLQVAIRQQYRERVLLEDMLSGETDAITFVPPHPSKIYNAEDFKKYTSELDDIAKDQELQANFDALSNSIGALESTTLDAINGLREDMTNNFAGILSSMAKGSQVSKLAISTEIESLRESRLKVLLENFFTGWENAGNSNSRINMNLGELINAARDLQLYGKRESDQSELTDEFKEQSEHFADYIKTRGELTELSSFFTTQVLKIALQIAETTIDLDILVVDDNVNYQSFSEQREPLVDLMNVILTNRLDQGSVYTEAIKKIHDVYDGIEDARRQLRAEVCDVARSQVLNKYPVGTLSYSSFTALLDLVCVEELDNQVVVILPVLWTSLSSKIASLLDTTGLCRPPRFESDNTRRELLLSSDKSDSITSLMKDRSAVVIGGLRNSNGGRNNVVLNVEEKENSNFDRSLRRKGGTNVCNNCYNTYENPVVLDVELEPEEEPDLIRAEWYTKLDLVNERCAEVRANAGEFALNANYADTNFEAILEALRNLGILQEQESLYAEQTEDLLQERDYLLQNSLKLIEEIPQTVDDSTKLHLAKMGSKMIQDTFVDEKGSYLTRKANRLVLDMCNCIIYTRPDLKTKDKVRDNCKALPFVGYDRASFEEAQISIASRVSGMLGDNGNYLSFTDQYTFDFQPAKEYKLLEVTHRIKWAQLREEGFEKPFQFTLLGPLHKNETFSDPEPFFSGLENVEMEKVYFIFAEREMDEENIIIPVGAKDKSLSFDLNLAGDAYKTTGNVRHTFKLPDYRGLSGGYQLPTSNKDCNTGSLTHINGKVCPTPAEISIETSINLDSYGNSIVNPSPYRDWFVQITNGHDILLKKLQRTDGTEFYVAQRMFINALVKGAKNTDLVFDAPLPDQTWLFAKGLEAPILQSFVWALPLGIAGAAVFIAGGVATKKKIDERNARQLIANGQHFSSNTFNGQSSPVKVETDMKSYQSYNTNAGPGATFSMGGQNKSKFSMRSAIPSAVTATPYYSAGNPHFDKNLL